MMTAAGRAGLTKACIEQRTQEEHTALDLAFQSKQWFAVQLLVTAGECCSASSAKPCNTYMIWQAQHAGSKVLCMCLVCLVLELCCNTYRMNQGEQWQTGASLAPLHRLCSITTSSCQFRLIPCHFPVTTDQALSKRQLPPASCVLDLISIALICRG